MVDAFGGWRIWGIWCWVDAGTIKSEFGGGLLGGIDNKIDSKFDSSVMGNGDQSVWVGYVELMFDLVRELRDDY